MINTLSKPGIKEDQSEEGIKKKKPTANIVIEVKYGSFSHSD